jgi:hypothetical protein
LTAPEWVSCPVFSGQEGCLIAAFCREIPDLVYILAETLRGAFSKVVGSQAALTASTRRYILAVFGQTKFVEISMSAEEQWHDILRALNLNGFIIAGTSTII